MAFQKGNIPWNKNKKESQIPWNKGLKGVFKHTEAHKKRMSRIAKEKGFGKWFKGRKQSKELIAKRMPKIIKALIGKHLSDETKNKLSEINKGKWTGEKNPRWQGGISKDRKEYSRQYGKTEKDKLRRKIYRQKNKESYRFYRMNRRAMELKSAGQHTIGEWETLKAQYDWTCARCGKKEPEIKLTEDHIIPLTKGGSNNIENIQPLCQSCNSIKHTQIIKY